MSLWRTGIVAGLLGCCLGSALRAQQVPLGSRTLPVDSWVYDYLQRLVTRGYLPNLNPLVQPYQRQEIARGLAALGPDTLAAPVAGWVRLLREEFANELAALAGGTASGWGIDVQGGVRGSTSGRLDPVRALGDRGAWPLGRGGVWVETGPLAVEGRASWDGFLRDDPDGVSLASSYPHSDHAYLSATLPWGSVLLGQLARNWGPIGGTGLMVSNVATSYPQIGVEIKAGRFALRSFLGELDTLQKADTTGFRYLAAHRLDYTSRDLVVSLGESSLYAWPDGGLRLRNLNPVEFLYLDADIPPYDLVNQNVMLDGQLWLRRGGVVFYLDALLDDIDVSPDSFPAEPPEYAFTVGARVTTLARWMEPGVEYQQVGAWAYRTNHIVDRYSFLNRGLGANYSDYDRLSLWADLYPPLAGLRLSPGLVLQRQGEGNFRDPNPGNTYAGQPALFLGVKERTVRLKLGGRYQPTRFAWVAWDVGPDFTRNRGHVAGSDGTRFEATGEIGVRLDFPRRSRP